MYSIIGKLGQIVIDLHNVARELGNEDPRSHHLRDIAYMIDSIAKRLRRVIN